MRVLKKKTTRESQEGKKVDIDFCHFGVDCRHEGLSACGFLSFAAIFRPRLLFHDLVDGDGEWRWLFAVLLVASDSFGW